MRIYDLTNDGDIGPGDIQECPLCGHPVYEDEGKSIANYSGAHFLIHTECGEEYCYSYQEGSEDA